MRTKVRGKIFYVYEHWRPDKDVCFWVGKGYGGRSHSRRNRNNYYNNIVAKLTRLGMCLEVRLVASGLNEKAALKLEIERIAFWRSVGIKLANMTNGGEGVAGLIHSVKSRRLMSESHKGQKVSHSAETRRKIGAANAIALRGRKNPEHSKRMRGRKLTEEHKAAISQGNMGRIFSDETKEKIRTAHLGKKASAKTRRILRLAHLGKAIPAATKEKMSVSIRRFWDTASEERHQQHREAVKRGWEKRRRNALLRRRVKCLL